MRRLIQSFLSIFLIILIGCQLQAKEPDYLKYTHEIINSFARDMEQEYGLICIGSGGRLATDVDSIGVDFTIYKRAELEEARKLIVKAKTSLINRVNAHEKIRPFLKEYPFTSKGADISIAFYNPDTNFYYIDGSIAFICSAKMGSYIAYDKMELQTRKNYGLVDKERGINIPDKIVEIEVFVPLLQETYEEALRIVNSK